MSRLSVRLSVAESGLRVQPSDFKIRISSLVDETVESLQSIWKEAGYEENECQGLLGDILTKLKTLCSAELCAEQQILEHAKNQVLSKFHEYQNLCNKLGRTGPQNVIQLGDNYADRLSQLEKLTSDIEIEISQRQEILTEKREEVETLAIQLGEEIKQGYDGDNQYCELDDIRLELINEYKKSLEELKITRISEIKLLATDILKYLNDLAVLKEGSQHLPDAKEFSDIDNSLITTSELNQNYGLSRHDIERLTIRLKNLQKEKEKRKEELSKNGAEIARMWTLLRIPTSERTAFQNSFEMNLSIATLTRGKEELARLKKIRLESMETVINTLREEIFGYWQELGIQSEDLMEKEFPQYFCEIKDLDDLGVEKHEEYCTTLKLKVEQLRPLLLKIAKREAVVEERVELEYLMMNPERLTARGPKAREDRKREEEMQRRVKNLEKMTKEVISYIAAWEESNGTTFLYAGEKYTDRIEAQEEHYIESRNSLRNQRKKKDGKELSSSGTLSTTPNTRIIKKAISTAPVAGSQIGQVPTKLFKEKSGILTPSTTTAGIISSHSNIPNNNLKTKTKLTTTTTAATTLTSSSSTTNNNNNSNLLKSNIEQQLDTSISLTQEEFNSIEQQENNYENNYDDDCDCDDPNSDRNSISSDNSDETEYTSMTEIKERASTATIVRMASNNLDR